MDAIFEKIKKIVPHGNADSLEVAIVSNYPCVVRKGEFKEGDIVFYIMDDAKLIGYDEYKERLIRDKEAAATGAFVTQDGLVCKFPWQTPLIKYLGGGGRVKTIRLRGKMSMGILLKAEDVSRSETNPYCCFVVNEENYNGINSLITDKEHGAEFLLNNFGVTHWESPSVTSVGVLNVAYQGLPCSLAISDEENWERLDENDLHFGKECLVTKKYDGSSCTVTCYPDGRHEVSMRRMTFRDETDSEKMNVYQKFSVEAVKAGLWWAKKHNETIAFRGECCCGSFNKSSYNKDCLRNDFFVYGVNFPDKKNFYDRLGLYGTKFHFTTIVKECNDNGFNLKTVDIVKADAVVTKELLEYYNNTPWNWGEGVVINIKFNEKTDADSESTVWHYKSKSREYLAKMK